MSLIRLCMVNIWIVCVLSVCFRAAAGAPGLGKTSVQARAEGRVDPQRQARHAEGSPAEPSVRPHPHPAALRQTA